MNVPPTLTSRYLDVGGAAQYLSVTPDSIYKAAQRRRIPFRRWGRKLVFDPVELDAYIQGLEGVDAKEAVARMLHDGTVKGLVK